MKKKFRSIKIKKNINLQGLKKKKTYKYQNKKNINLSILKNKKIQTYMNIFKSFQNIT